MRLVYLALICALCVACQASAADRFDLICKASAGSPAQAGWRLRIDLASRRFCYDGCPAVYHLTTILPARLEYHFSLGKPDADHGPNSLRAPAAVSTAGPWDQKDDFTFERASGAFHRTLVYSQGDPGARLYSKTFDGVCTPVAFSGFAGRG